LSRQRKAARALAGKPRRDLFQWERTLLTSSRGERRTAATKRIRSGQMRGKLNLDGVLGVVEKKIKRKKSKIWGGQLCPRIHAEKMKRRVLFGKYKPRIGELLGS